MIFENGTREPLHGHNYRVTCKGETPDLKDDMVMDFLDFKPIVREVCDSLDHKLLIPKNHPRLKFYEQGKNIVIETPDESIFSIPQTDVLMLPIENTSSERIAVYVNELIRTKTFEKFGFKFSSLETEVEETPGQSAVYVYKETP